LVFAWFYLPWLFTGKAAIAFLIADILATPPAIVLIMRRKQRRGTEKESQEKRAD